MTRVPLGVVTVVTLAVPLSAQLAPFQSAPQFVPFGSENSSPTLAIQFGDVDNDGDFDALLASGGEWGPHQNRIWYNWANLQGGVLGDFVDGTQVHFPLTAHASTDVEILDFDDDGDLDLFWSTLSDSGANAGRFWTNQAGLQGGGISFYVDDNATRWGGLAQAGSSVPATELVFGGGYRSWSVDAEFFDVDDDGDLDLAYSSHGENHDGLAPTRVFLNDGAGVFFESNLSGVTLGGLAIPDGVSALWASGLQADATTDTTGAFADVATRVADLEVADIDGDFDLDLILFNERTTPRAFANQARGSGLAPSSTTGSFRDVTATVFPSGTPIPVRGRDLELLDFDLDGSLEALALDWGPSFEDWLVDLGGGGVFATTGTLLGGVLTEDRESEIFDVNGDGALDLYVARFGGPDRVYLNLSLAQAPALTPPTGSATDAAVSDVDGDGDWDVLVARDNFEPNELLLNTSDAPDSSAPTCARIETIAPVVGQDPWVFHATMTDDVTSKLTRFYDLSAPYFVDGCRLGRGPVRWSGGELFRAEIPGNLVGTVTYRLRAVDLAGNIGASNFVTVNAAGPNFQSSFGVGTNGPLGEPTVRALSVPYPGTTLWLAGENTTPGALSILVLAPQQVTPAFALSNLLTLNVGGPFFHLFDLGAAGPSGCFITKIELPEGLSPGQTSYAQFFTSGGTTQILASSKGVSLTIQ